MCCAPIVRTAQKHPYGRKYQVLKDILTSFLSGVSFLFSVTSTKCESATLHFALNIMIYVDKYRNIVYNIVENRFWAYLIIFEVTDMKKAIRKTKFVLF